MNIAQLLANITPTKISVEVTGLCLHSNNVTPGDVFIALPGQSTHGIDYIDNAISKGCVAVLTDSETIQRNIPIININSLSTHLATLANTFYKNANKVKIIGVTGTNGKTSVAHFISQLLTMFEVKNGFIGTLGVSNSQQQTKHTTPDIFTLYQILEEYHQLNIDTAVLEVSSHGIHQNRIIKLNIIQAVLTNLTQDHLDYHLDLDEYRLNKQKLFTLDSVKTVVLNKDDGYYPDFLKASKGKQINHYQLSDFDNIKITQQGFLLHLNNHIFELPFLGEFNLANILAALQSVKAIGFKKNQITPMLHKLTLPPGRMQKIHNHLIWIDYAHTPDAIKNALITLKKHYPNFKITIVFGCGGNRDKGKRAKMGGVASMLANAIILTNDNPRSENPQAIIDDILIGINNQCNLNIVKDRQLAIQTAVNTLQKDECLLIAGKGHENTQQFKDKTAILNDLDIVKNAIKMD